MTALLLAEPEPAVRGFLERQLRNDGFDVVACERAEQLPRAADPDVLVLGDAEALDRGVVPGLSGDRARRRRSRRSRAGARARGRLPRPPVRLRGAARAHPRAPAALPAAGRADRSRPARDRPRGAPRARGRGARSSCRRRSSRCSSSSRPTRTASSRASSCSATSGASARTSRRGRSSRTPPVSGASSTTAGLAGWVVNVWGVGYKLRHVPSPDRETLYRASSGSGPGGWRR